MATRYTAESKEINLAAAQRAGQLIQIELDSPNPDMKRVKLFEKTRDRALLIASRCK